MPYLFSHSLRFSYGSNKGRDDTRWQIALETLPTKEALLKLEQYGFSAVLIHKKAYADNAKGLTEIIKQLHYEMIGESPSLIAFRLHPSATPISPAPAWQLVNSGELELVDPETAYQWKMPRDQYALTIKRPWYLRLDPKSPYSTNSPLALDFISSKNCSVWYQFNNHEMLELRISAGKAAKAIVLPNAKQDNTLLLKHDCASNNAGSTTPIKNSDAPLVMRQMMN